MAEAIETPFAVGAGLEPAAQGHRDSGGRLKRLGLIVVLVIAILWATDAISWWVLFAGEWLVEGTVSISRSTDHSAFIDAHLGSLVSVASIVYLPMIVPWLLWSPKLAKADWRTWFGIAPIRWSRWWAWALTAAWLDLIYAVVEPSLRETSASGLQPEDILATSYSPILVFLGIVIATPIFEELWVRGFIQGGLRSIGLGHGAAIGLALVPWVGIHLHLDLYDLTAITVMGAVAAVARASSGSVLPAIAVHFGWNVTVFAISLVKAGDG